MGVDISIIQEGAKILVGPEHLGFVLNVREAIEKDPDYLLNNLPEMVRRVREILEDYVLDVPHEASDLLQMLIQALHRIEDPDSNRSTRQQQE